MEGLNFNDYQIGLLAISGAVMTYLGLLAYRIFLFNTSWQLIYIWTTIIVFIFAILQLLLIYQVNITMGIPNIFFALGDSTISVFVIALQYMPTAIMYVTLCPDGSEGTTYALLTTIRYLFLFFQIMDFQFFYSNLASTVGIIFGTWMSEIWNVSNST